MPVVTGHKQWSGMRSLVSLTINESQVLASFVSGGPCASTGQRIKAPLCFQRLNGLYVTSEMSESEIKG